MARMLYDWTLGLQGFRSVRELDLIVDRKDVGESQKPELRIEWKTD